MKILKKLGLTLFSLMFFCGMSITVFASEANIDATAYVKDDNSSIVLQMRSNDGKKHNYSMFATYYDRRDRYIDHKASTDEYDYKTKNKTVEWNDIRDWSRVKIMMFSDGEFVRSMTLKKSKVNVNGLSILFFSEEGNKITAVMKGESSKKYEYKARLTCYDKNSNIMDIDKDKAILNGEGEIHWLILPDWHVAELDITVNGEKSTLRLSR